MGNATDRAGDRTIRFFSLGTGRGAPLALAFSPDGKWLAASTNSVKTGVQVFSVGSGAEVARSVPLSLFSGGLTWSATRSGPSPTDPARSRA